MHGLRVAALGAVLMLALASAPSASAAPDGRPCDGPNEFVIQDLVDTASEPTDPQCGSLTRPCFLGGHSCYGCGPDVLEWVIGPIHCI